MTSSALAIPESSAPGSLSARGLGPGLNGRASMLELIDYLLDFGREARYTVSRKSGGYSSSSPLDRPMLKLSVIGEGELWRTLQGRGLSSRFTGAFVDSVQRAVAEEFPLSQGTVGALVDRLLSGSYMLGSTVELIALGQIIYLRIYPPRS